MSLGRVKPYEIALFVDVPAFVFYRSILPRLLTLNWCDMHLIVVVSVILPYTPASCV